MLRVGLTGGIACGKSHVLRRLAASGFPTLDLDAVARDVVAPGSPAFAEVAKAFGPGVVAPDGSLDRSALATLVFADPSARARLNAIVHPRVRAVETRWTEALAADAAGVVVTDAALLVEAGAHLRFDRLVVVHCDPAQQLVRLRRRDGLDEAAARARIAAQMPLSEKRSFAHFEIDTSGAVEETDRASDALAEELRARGRAHAAGARGARPLVARLLGGLVHGPEAGPRGLSPIDVLASIVESGGLEMEALAGRLVPPAGGPWYRAAAAGPPGAPAAALGPALVAWALSRGAPDPPFLASAAASLARLSHADAAALADACLYALVLQEVATGSTRPDDLGALVARHTGLAERWGGGPPSRALEPVWVAARRCPGDPRAAGAASASAGGDPGLAGALVGAAVGAERAQAPPPLAEALDRLTRSG